MLYENKKISVRRFRSIEQTGDIELKNYTVFVGKNNEGKTNIVSAINLAFRYFKYWDRNILDRINLLTSVERYEFTKDYPVELQCKSEDYIKKHPTIIELTFDFNEDEISSFKSETKLSYSVAICIQLYFFRDKFEITVKNRNNNMETKKKIVGFINRRINPTIIPTIRTSRQSMEIIDRIVQSSLFSLRKDEKYNDAYNLIKKMEGDRLDELSRNLIPTLSNFLPNIKNIKIDLDFDNDNYLYRRNLDLIIDDGVLTSIDNKGDGIKSLIQMALLKATSKNNGGVIIVEEPEAHLHSGAVHELNEVLHELSVNQQVIITTHSSIFVNGHDYHANILISDGKCHPIDDIQELRETLGIQVSDSLFASDFVILVEGESDKKILMHLLAEISPTFEKLLEKRKIIFYETRGTTKAKSFMVLMKQLLINYYCIWDGDTAGKEACEEARKLGLIDSSNYTCIPSLDKKEAELEDLLNVKLTNEYVEKKYMIKINENESKKSKWSDRIKNSLFKLGKEFSENDEEKIKIEMATHVENMKVNEIVNPAYKDYLSGLANNILKVFNLE